MSITYTLYDKVKNKRLDAEPDPFNIIPIIGETVVDGIPYYIHLMVPAKKEAIVIPKSYFKEDE